MNDKKLKQKMGLVVDLASGLIQSLDEQQRHDIYIKNSEIVVPLTAAVLMSRGLSENDAVEYIRLATETLFALGYLAGQKDCESQK